ncbi:hypothetical protein [Hyphomonas sp.]|uniref:hypothetical protein n=1 Tax=Hyphomonas sp. TaxID=87 RepID=UPI0030FB3DFB
MKKILPIALVLGGAAIALIVGVGIKMTNTRSDAEIILDTIHEERALDTRQADDAAVLTATILPTPESCIGLSTRFVFRICDGEPSAGNLWPDWTSVTAPEERTCILGAFHQTNAHAHRIQGSRYDMAEPDNERVSAFVSDLCAAVLWADHMRWGDDKPLGELMDAYYADRAESMIAPKHSY